MKTPYRNTTTRPQRAHPDTSAPTSYDNALAETIIGLYKTEVTHHLDPWRGATDVETATLEWVHCFNQQRLLVPIGDMPPAEFEQMHCRQQGQAAA